MTKIVTLSVPEDMLSEVIAVINKQARYRRDLAAGIAYPGDDADLYPIDADREREHAARLEAITAPHCGNDVLFAALQASGAWGTSPVTHDDLTAARRRLGFADTAAGLAAFGKLLGLAPRSAYRQVYRWEAGERPIPERIALRLRIMEMERRGT